MNRHYSKALRLLPVARFLGLAVLISELGLGLIGAEKLPYGKDFPPSVRVWYDNDEADDVLTDELFHALHSAGAIDLRGMTTTYPRGAPGWPNGKEVSFERFHRDRLRIAKLAEDWMVRSLPLHRIHAGPVGPIPEPEGKSIEDKIAASSVLGSPGTFALLSEVLYGGYSSEDPLLIVTGGPLTTVADAYLAAKSLGREKLFAENIVLGSVLANGFDSWNTKIDYWAAFICANRLKIVLSGMDRGHVVPGITDSWLQRNLPDNPLRAHMIEHKRHGDSEQTPIDGEDRDAGPVMPLLTDGFYHSFQVMEAGSLSDWTTWEPMIERPFKTFALQPNPMGRLFLIIQRKPQPGTSSWRKALSHPDVWIRR